MATSGDRNLAIDRLAGRAARLIPARAGSTNPPLPGPHPGSAHPRASGEHLPQTRQDAAACGSSPRERGAPDAEDDGLGGGRLIPARAGSTRLWSRWCSVRSAHPRASGEHRTAWAYSPGVYGSSPRERGAHQRDHPQVRVRRLIPARAGSTTRATCHPRWKPAHPRASGEHAPHPLWVQLDDGSSPRERGALGLGVRCRVLVRLIPARAGSTTPLRAVPRTGSAHPRASGEHTNVTLEELLTVGSSPRERGAPRGARGVLGRVRLIPARAGSTAASTAATPGQPAHPRASGEHTITGDPRLAVYGSSPRERGALLRREEKIPALRLIPARAGSTG